jgi:hypothetical protein
MDPIRKFIKRLFKDQPPQKTTEEYLIERLEEKVEDLKESGLSEKEAIDQSIMEFGDADDYYLPTLDKEKRRYQRYKTVKHYLNDLVFSSLAALLIIAILVMINILYLNNLGPWSAVVGAAILFWPLSIFYRWLNQRLKR